MQCTFHWSTHKVNRKLQLVKNSTNRLSTKTRKRVHTNEQFKLHFMFEKCHMNVITVVKTMSITCLYL